MSQWAYVSGVIVWNLGLGYVDKIPSYARQLLKNAPKVTGSEGDMTIRISQPKGYNFSSGVVGKDGTYEIKHGQSIVLLTLHGDLRDKSGEATMDEITQLIEYIDKQRGFVESYCIRISDTYNYEKIHVYYDAN